MASDDKWHLAIDFNHPMIYILIYRRFYLLVLKHSPSLFNKDVNSRPKRERQPSARSTQQ